MCCSGTQVVPMKEIMLFAGTLALPTCRNVECLDSRYAVVVPSQACVFLASSPVEW